LLVPSTSSVYESAKNGLGVIVVFETALRMPLNSQDEVISGSAFDGFYNSVFRTYGADQQPVSGKLDGLVVARIDVNFRRSVILVDGGSDNVREHGAGFDYDRVNDVHAGRSSVGS